jgi:hypothetical protein
MTTTRALACVCAGLLALTAGHGAAQPPKPPGTSDSFPIPPESEAMKEKRIRAHAVLDALTAGDAEAVRKNAQSLMEIADMRVFVAAYKTERYKFHAQSFRAAVEDLHAAAKAKNLDAAALAYADMTRTCVKCHTHYRGVK